MTFNAGTVISEARDAHPEFMPDRSPQGLVRRFVDRYQRELVGKILEIRPAFFDSTMTTAMPLGTFDSGITMPSAMYIKQVIAQLASDATQYGQSQVELMPWANRLGLCSMPAASLNGDKLILLGMAEDWAQYSSISTRYVALPAELVTDAVNLILPDYAKSACITATSAFLARRLAGRRDSTVNLGPFIQEALDTEQALLNLIGRQGGAEAMRIRDVL